MFNAIKASLPDQWAASLLVSLACILGVLALVRIITRPKRLVDENDEWRDPPPMLYLIFKPLVRMLAPEVHKFLSEDLTKRLSMRLSAAGMNYALLPEEFITLRYVCLVVGGITSVSLYKLDSSLGPEVMIFIILLAPIGFFYPEMWLTDKISQRRREVTKEFPFLLDLLVLSMRAGLNYSGALAQAIGALPAGVVRDEFGKLLREIRAGKPRRNALLDLGERMNIEAVSNFVAAINQAEETGGEIVQVLTAQAQQRRDERFHTAEELAGRAPIRMLMPMMAFLFPIIFMLMGFIIIVKLAEIGYLPVTMLELLKK